MKPGLAESSEVKLGPAESGESKASTRSSALTPCTTAGPSSVSTVSSKGPGSEAFLEVTSRQKASPRISEKRRQTSVQKVKKNREPRRRLTVDDSPSPRSPVASKPSVASFSNAVPVMRSNAKVNLKVVRGKDWQWEDEDGSPGKVGVVMAVDSDAGTVAVYWQATNQMRDHYRYVGKQDLGVAPDDAIQASEPPRRRSFGPGMVRGKAMGRQSLCNVADTFGFTTELELVPVRRTTSK